MHALRFNDKGRSGRYPRPAPETPSPFDRELVAMSIALDRRELFAGTAAIFATIFARVANLASHTPASRQRVLPCPTPAQRRSLMEAVGRLDVAQRGYDRLDGPGRIRDDDAIDAITKARWDAVESLDALMVEIGGPTVAGAIIAGEMHLRRSVYVECPDQGEPVDVVRFDAGRIIAA